MPIDVLVKDNLADSPKSLDQKKFLLWILRLKEFLKEWSQSNDCNYEERTVTVRINSPCIISSVDILELIKSSIKQPSVIFSAINYDGSKQPIVEVFIEKTSSKNCVHSSAIAFPFSSRVQSNSSLETVNVIIVSGFI